MAYTTIDKPTDYFNTKLYTGNGSTQSITGVGFQPDWLWIKERSSTSAHTTHDVVRGATKYLVPNTSEPEGTGYVSSFDSDGFSVTQNNLSNENSQTYVSWNWLAGGTASSNTDGSITSSISANTTAGFSIVSYTGTGANATVGHGIGSAPKIIFIKNRNLTSPNDQSWSVYSKEIGAGNFLKLDSTDASASNSTRFNSTDPTSSVFSLGTHGSGNGSGDTYIAYCFAEKKGFSRFGSYVGNGSSDGSYIHLGFKPAWVMVKKTNSSGDEWNMFDNKRDVDNVIEKRLVANINGADAPSTYLDFLSNGFKWRTSNNLGNGSGNTYIYMAFAENPFVTSTGIPTTAR